MVEREEEPIARHLPLRAAGGAFERWVEVEDEAELLALVRRARAEGWKLRPIPPFTDALPPEGGLTGVGLRLGFGFEGIAEEGDRVRVGASVPLARVGLRRGYEALREAPGTLADAWEEGWIQPALTRVRRFRGRGVEETEEVAADGKSLLVAGWLRPGVKLGVPRAGQAFREVRRRGVDLREVLDRFGLRGLRLVGASLAEDDPAVLVNRGDASPRQLRLLVQAARERVYQGSGLELEERLWAPGRGGRL